MRDEQRDGRVAFLLSLAMPGAGQLWIGSLWGVAWLLAAALLIMFWGLVAENVGRYSALLHFLSFIALGLLSGENARRMAKNERAG